MSYTPPRIDEEYGGPTAYLDKTKDEHNGVDAATLKKHWNWGQKPHMSVSALAMMCGVVWSTMDDWLDRLHAEAKIDRPRPRKVAK